MNSIFVEICKQHLLNIIDTAIDNSRSADQSFANQGLGYIGWQRNEQLAEDKRQHMKKLRAVIETYNPTIINDDGAFSFFTEQLTSTKRIITASSKEKDKSQGITGFALSKGLELIPAIAEQLRQTSLLNVPRDNEPLHLFQYYIAHYFATKVANQIDATVIQQVTESIQLSKFKSRERERERTILSIIADCKSTIAALPIDRFDYKKLVRLQVTTSIERLQTADAQLTTKYGALLTGTLLALSFFGGAQPDEALLPNLLDSALHDINQTAQGLPKVATSEWEDLNPDVQITTIATMAELENEQRESVAEAEQTAITNIMRLFEQGAEQLRAHALAPKAKPVPTLNSNEAPTSTRPEEESPLSSSTRVTEVNGDEAPTPTIPEEAKAAFSKLFQSTRSDLMKLEKEERGQVITRYKLTGNV